MYHSRKEDLHPRVAAIAEESKILLEAFEHIEGRLKALQDPDPKDMVVYFYDNFLRQDYFTFALDKIPKDLQDEMEETKKKLDQSCLDAFITLLEAEREDLIKKYNALIKTK
jgi:hypothetical protein